MRDRSGSADAAETKVVVLGKCDVVDVASFVARFPELAIEPLEVRGRLMRPGLRSTDRLTTLSVPSLSEQFPCQKA